MVRTTLDNFLHAPQLNAGTMKPSSSSELLMIPFGMLVHWKV